jgi:hypothetical protein
MDRLRLILDKHSRWQPLSEYIERIEGYRHSDFSICVENSKSLLESIAKEICGQKGQPLTGTEKVGRVLGLSFGCLGYPPSDTIRQIGTAIANVGHQMGTFRNQIGTTSHGKTLEELRSREGAIDSLTEEFLLTSTELVCCFLIEAFEADNPLNVPEIEIDFDDNLEFNVFWDDQYGDFEMGDYSFGASAILFSLDPLAYQTELRAFDSIQLEIEQLETAGDEPLDETDNGK